LAKVGVLDFLDFFSFPMCSHQVLILFSSGSPAFSLAFSEILVTHKGATNLAKVFLG
jgi:hypothetical protein